MPIDPTVLPEKFLRCMEPAERRRLGKAGLTQQEIQNRQAVRLERDLHDQIEAYLRVKGIRVAVHSRMDRPTTQQRGIPDFLFCWDGRPVALEAKRPGEQPSPEQIGIMAGMEQDGWFVRVVRSLEEVRAALEEIANEPHPRTLETLPNPRG